MVGITLTIIIIITEATVMVLPATAATITQQNDKRDDSTIRNKKQRKFTMERANFFFV